MSYLHQRKWNQDNNYKLIIIIGYYYFNTITNNKVFCITRYSIIAGTGRKCEDSWYILMITYSAILDDAKQHSELITNIVFKFFQPRLERQSMVY